MNVAFNAVVVAWPSYPYHLTTVTANLDVGSDAFRNLRAYYR